MTVQQLKTEIQKSLDNVPESVLQDILMLLKQAENHSADNVQLLKNFKAILTEDKELLERLAK